MKTSLTILVLVASAFGFIYYQNSQAPKLGIENSKLKPLGSRPNGVSTQAQDPKKKVEPLVFKATPEATMEAIEQAVITYGGVEIVEKSSDYLYVVFTTPTMKFHDDAEFYLDSANKLVHYRSQSRAGYSDRGLNAKRFKKLAAAYQEI